MHSLQYRNSVLAYAASYFKGFCILANNDCFTTISNNQRSSLTEVVVDHLAVVISGLGRLCTDQIKLIALLQIWMNVVGLEDVAQIFKPS